MTHLPRPNNSTRLKAELTQHVGGKAHTLAFLTVDARFDISRSPSLNDESGLSGSRSLEPFD